MRFGIVQSVRSSSIAARLSIKIPCKMMLRIEIEPAKAFGPYFPISAFAACVRRLVCTIASPLRLRAVGLFTLNPMQ